ncbi:hypothetical protein RJ639_005820 [Escallonia herrerae]|uniref:Calcineurin-like phosphoesterase domain-containing protein n=1 Tax=Escallonia herrerae TaxID=1293975 RepID=A0AA89ATS5_9ASTE|nr:hypothetical protein RJ639_005820 [Escallonia herrerae]
MESTSICAHLPNLLSSFVDTFVDYTISGIFLPPQATNPLPSPPPLQTLHPPVDRLIAVGDLHGDLQKAQQALRLAGIVDSAGGWCGGAATLVQVGDVLDRGGDEIRILYFLERLKRQAAKSGGKVITMNGNHEIMNIDGDFRCVTKSGVDEFKVWADWYNVGNSMKSLCHGLKEPKDIFNGLPTKFNNVRDEYNEGFRARLAALRPQGPISTRFLSRNETVVVVGESVFVHGGLLPDHVVYGLERINEEVRDWIVGVKGRVSSSLVRGRDSVVWLRRFSEEVAGKCDCSTLERVLAVIPGAKRMVMGHTIQQSGINGACGNRAIRIDVGMSRGCGDGLPEVLEIVGNSELRVLTSNSLYRKEYESSLEVDRKEGLAWLISESGPKQVEVKA